MATATVLGFTLTLTPPLLTALRIVPLVGSTASLTHAWVEWVATSSFLHAPTLHPGVSPKAIKAPSAPLEQTPDRKAEVAKASEVVVPIWFVNFFNKALWSVIGLNAITGYSAMANVFLFPSGLGEHRRIYTVGLASAVAHYAFVPAVMWSVEALFKIYDTQEKGSAEKHQEGRSATDLVRAWVNVHKIRMCTVDLVTWACFAVGVVNVLTTGSS